MQMQDRKTDHKPHYVIPFFQLMDYKVQSLDNNIISWLSIWIKSPEKKFLNTCFFEFYVNKGDELGSDLKLM